MVIYNSDLGYVNPGSRSLASYNFTVSGTVTDTTPPGFTSQIISRSIAAAGEAVTVTVHATDDMLGVDHINVYYQTPITKKDRYLTAWPHTETYRKESNIDLYQFTMPFYRNTISNTYVFDIYVSICVNC